MRKLISGLILFLLFSTLFDPAVVPALAQKALATNSSDLVIAKRARFAGDVILIRGGFNVFSRGMDQIAAKLAKRGVKTTVIQYTSSQSALATILSNQKQHGRTPVILIGHSWGANAVIRIATALEKKRVTVTYAATFAATNPDPIPGNIRKITNYYFKTDGWGEPIKRSPRFRGRLKNIDLSKKTDVHHFNIEEQLELQNQVIRNVLRLIRTSKSS